MCFIGAIIPNRQPQIFQLRCLGDLKEDSCLDARSFFKSVGHMRFLEEVFLGDIGPDR